jgi:hypothetical protein
MKKKWKKHRGEIIRSTIFLSIVILIFLGLAKKGGVFSISDRLNGVVQTKTEYKNGSYTYIKETTPDKVVTWIDSYSDALTPVIDNGQAYYYREEVTASQVVMEYDIKYRTDRSYEEVQEFYKNHYGSNVGFMEINDSAVMWPEFLSYRLQIKVEEVDEQVEVSMNAKYYGGSVLAGN